MKALEKQLAAQWVWTGAAALLQTGSKVCYMIWTINYRGTKKEWSYLPITYIAGVKQVLPNTGYQHGHSAPALRVVCFLYTRESQQAQ